MEHMSTPQSAKVTARENNTSVKEVNRAFHDARDAAAKEGGHGVPADRHSGGKGGGEKSSGKETMSGKFWG